MADILFLAVVVAFFALAALYVRACEAIVGREEVAEPAEDAAADEVARA